MVVKENQLFKGIGKRIENVALQKVVISTAEGVSETSLQRELKVVSDAIEKTNQLISSTVECEDLKSIQSTKETLNSHGLMEIPNPIKFTDNRSTWLRTLVKTIEVGNAEVGTTYRAPEKINDGDPLSVFRWYLYDGIGRMVSINMGISNENKKQEEVGDLVTCAITEGLVVLADEGDEYAVSVVGNMLDMGFIAKGWLFSDSLVERAESTKS